MSKSSVSGKYAFFLAIMSLMVAVLCVTIEVIQENLEARIIMATIWIIIGVFWLIKSATIKKPGVESEASKHDQ